MPQFGKLSRANLSECHPDIQRLFAEVIKHWDCTVLDGARTMQEQRANLAKGVSKTLDSKHLPQPDGYSWAADVAPYPVQWNDPSPKVRAAYERECLFFGGFVLGIAEELGIDLRYGGDWDSDRDLEDQTFNDLVHFEKRRAA